MTEPVRIGDAELWLGDCREILLRLGKVAGVVTDPPYPNMRGGTVYNFDGVGKRRTPSVTVGDPWDASLDWMPLAEGAATKVFAVFCSFHSVAEVKAAATLPAAALAVWHKRNAPPSIQNAPRQTTEFIWLFRAGPNARWRSIKDTVFSVLNATAGCVTSGERLVGADGKAFHPAQKPVAIMEPLVMLVDEGETVCDPFAGTGTTGVACARLGRKFIGIERDPRYFEAACRRIEAAYAQPSFLPHEAVA